MTSGKEIGVDDSIKPISTAKTGMHPIETEWHGYKFRSRLEARWAVVFESLGIDWEYEPEGFEFDDGTKYLPDFLLHGMCGRTSGDLYVEVKGAMTEEDKHKIRQFSEHKPIYIVGAIKPNATGLPRYWYQFMEDVCSGNDFYYNFEHIDGDYFGAFLGVDYYGRPMLFGADGNYLDESNTVLTDAAYKASLLARFEHGETPETSTDLCHINYVIKFIKENNIDYIELSVCSHHIWEVLGK